MDESAFDTFSPYTKRSYKRPKGFVFIAIIVILLFLLVFIGIRLLGAQEENEKVVSLSPTATPASEPSPTPQTPTGKLSGTPKPSPTKSTPKPGSLDRSELSVEVLNGSGTPGAAKAVADDLEELGYNVVSTGNASNFGYEDVSVSVKSGKKSYLDQLKKDLAANYTIGSASAQLSPSSSSDAVVIVGKE